MSEKKPKYAWDTSVFLAWLTEQADAPLADIEAVAEEIDKNVAALITSTTTYSEVLEVKHSKDKMDQFRDFLKRSNIVTQDVTVTIAEKAQEIRGKALAEGRKIKTPDAQHLATAILCKADVLHSLDPDMLNLDGSPIVDGLKIKLPVPLSGQHEMFRIR
jgi:predicted nucleic acid-binding protein